MSDVSHLAIGGRKVGWAPLPGSQTMVLKCTSIFELLYHGTRGPGKSDTLLMDFAQFVGRGWGLQYKGIIFRQTYPQLEDLITKSKRWFPKIFPGARYNGSANKWVFPDGEELLFRQFNKPIDYWKYHGQEFQFIGWDELTNWPTLEGYTSMMSCLRTTHPDIPLRCRATTNPYGPGHNVVKFHFELPAKDGIIRRKTYEFEDPETGEPIRKQLCRVAIKGTIWENTILLKAQPNYIAQLKEQADNPAKLAAWLEGSWDIVAGGMFDDVWDPKINVVQRFIIPRSWKLDRSFDWGSSAPFSVGWWAESDGSDFQDSEGRWRSSVRGDLYRVAEWYGWRNRPNEGLKMLAVDIAKGIREREMILFPTRTVQPGPADSSIYDVENGVSIGADMEKKIRMEDGSMKKGIVWTRADKRAGSRKTGWEMMRKMMRDAGPNRDDKGTILGTPREKPGLFVMDNCDQFIRTVPVLPRCEKDPDDVDSDAEDHVGDETRYRVRFVGNRAATGSTTGMY
ncbi:terminase [Alphaproteobacteria phage PhiJL001]|uniref:Terminase n=1 Tax=Alphaproteobacteria phage PhiJL001 TaxID=2681607 RepID=Q5DN46_9CAUD|nr:terminase large subunit [Alphaproteobacteria phage PhiJL001]AAT69535.1 terminase [Alphaproteobacteria phage PhiJL001]